MSADNENRRVYVSAEGVDFDDDEAIRAFADRVWAYAAAALKGEPVPDTDQHHTSKDDSASGDAPAPKQPTTYLTARYAEAVAYASAIHATQVRKGTDTTYLCHLLGVSALVLEAGGTEDEAIAALLHDAVEDAGGMARERDIRARFCDRVAEIVLHCSDSTDEAVKAAEPYGERKQRYLDRLEASDDRGALLVSIADKLHNARAIMTDIDRDGAGVLSKFNGTPDQIRYYYSELLRIATVKSVPDTLLLPFKDVVGRISDAVMTLPEDVRAGKRASTM